VLQQVQPSTQQSNGLSQSQTSDSTTTTTERIRTKGTVLTFPHNAGIIQKKVDNVCLISGFAGFEITFKVQQWTTIYARLKTRVQDLIKKISDRLNYQFTINEEEDDEPSNRKKRSKTQITATTKFSEALEFLSLNRSFSALISISVSNRFNNLWTEAKKIIEPFPSLKLDMINPEIGWYKAVPIKKGYTLKKSTWDSMFFIVDSYLTNSAKYITPDKEVTFTASS